MSVQRGRVGAASDGSAPEGGLFSNPFLLCLLLLVVATVSRAHAYIAPLRVLRPAMMLVLLAGVFALMRPAVLRLENVSRAWPGKVILGFALMACLSIPFGISVGRAGRFFLEDYWKTLLMTVLLLVAIRRPLDLWRLAWAFVIAVGLLALLSLFVFGISKTQGAYGYDANDVGLIMVTGVPLALLVTQGSRASGKIVGLLVLVLAVATIAKSQSRGAFIGVLAVGLGLLVFVRSIGLGKRMTFIALAAVVLAAEAPPGYWDLVRTLTAPKDDYNWTAKNGRKELVQRGFSYMMTYPMFGIGINNFQMAEGTISEKAEHHVTGTGIRWAAAHNSYIQAGAEMGVPGFALWMTLLLGGMVACARLSRRVPPHWARGQPEQRYLYQTAMYLPVALLGFAASSFFVSFAYLEPVYILAAMLSGLMVTARRALDESAVRAQAPAPRNGPRLRWNHAPVNPPLVAPLVQRGRT